MDGGLKNNEISGCGKTVTVTYFQRDHYGRILGQVYAPDGMNVNQFMVRAGDAWVYEQYNTDPVLPVLQGEVRQQKRGLWADSALFALGMALTEIMIFLWLLSSH